MRPLLCRLLHWLAPEHCGACDVALLGGGLCGSCLARLPARGPGRQLGELPLAPAFAYADPLIELIHRFKYADRPDLADTLAQLITWRTQVPSILVPVPLHPRRLASRGYNQAALLARALSARTKVPMAANLLIRVVDSPPQARTPAAERPANVRAAFRAKPRRSNAGLVLVDDVVTTGSTLSACAAVLRGQGHVVLGALTVCDAHLLRPRC